MVLDDIAIHVRDLSKRYELYAKPHHRLAQMLLRGRRQFFGEFWPLRNISFNVKKGEAVGIVGRNGAGKSTLLQIIAGVLSPTQGDVEVHGRVAALLELGSGFNPEFTGRENAYLNGSILGLTRKEMDAAMPEIIRFAAIGDFFDQPVKHYSSGMMVRVAFAVQVQLNPDVLIVDEALAVGDALFQKRCYQRIRQLRDRGVAILFVSHDIESVRTFTDRAILLHHGEVMAAGPSGEVVLAYRKLLHDEENLAKQKEIAEHKQALKANTAPAVAAPVESPQLTAPAATAEPLEAAAAEGHLGQAVSNVSDAADQMETEARNEGGKFEFGSLEALITDVSVLDGAGEQCTTFYTGDTVKIVVKFSIREDMDKLYVNLRIRNKEGIKMYSWGTFNQDAELIAGKQDGFVFWNRKFRAGEEHSVVFTMDSCALGENFYEVQASLIHQESMNFSDQAILHWIDEAAFFMVRARVDTHFFGGVCDLHMRAELEAPTGEAS
ncbi:ABC transporter related [Paraburkholderia phytofirmans PsJN]|uniref:ABC transporter related n=1 Tax=Paraburkholderia phytofirmans (strain DSM 17436 / LMG 22146 / PsJN) TaxID=398527 RepID=B2T0K1_PARPJ|nr:ABC transporter ATP-binding protein [Paraburkholderia phytofirmans]ACD15306.1 ABC transporter related [Paraburkholderia phytofirmans PsJN]